MDKVKYIGAAIGHSAGVVGCEQAPDVIREKLHLASSWHKTLYHDHTTGKNNTQAFADFSNALAKTTSDVLKSHQKFITFGGDHSCAVGTWSGVAEHYAEFGLIWIDAHMDSHTHESSLTGNLHGMPVASLLGQGMTALTHIHLPHAKIKPENIVLIGIRSYEDDEKTLLQKLGVKVFEMDEVNEMGFAACFEYALNRFKQANLPFGISLDVDGLDPSDIHATGLRVENGVLLDEVCAAFKTIDTDKLIGLEIVEYNPTLDDENFSDLNVVKQLIEAVMR
jgi:arginase